MGGVGGIGVRLITAGAQGGFPYTTGNILMKCFRLLPVVLAALLVAPLSGARAETPDEIYTFASRLQKDGMYEAAAQQYLRFARVDARDARVPGALAAAADCLVKSDNTAQAVAILETVTSTYPDNPDRCRFNLSLGHLYYKLKRYSDADRVFTRIVVTMTDCPEVPAAMLGKGETLISVKQYAAALDVLSKVLDHYADTEAAPRAAYNLAFCQRKLGNEDGALATYARLVTDYPRAPLAGFAALEAARIHGARGHVDKAVSFYARAWDFGTKVIAVPAGTEAAALLAHAGQAREALAWYERILSRDDIDDRRAVYVHAVGTAYSAGDDAAVVQLAQEYEARFPGTFSPQITYAHARSSLRKKHYDVALADAERLETLARGSAWGQSAFRIRGEALLGRADAHAAVDALARFVDVSSDSTARCEVLGKIADVSFSVTHDTSAAVGALQKLLDVEKHRNPAEMNRVARRFELANRYASAREVYADVTRRFPLSKEAGDAEKRMAWLDEFSVTDYRAALREFDRRAYAMAANSSRGLLGLAEARIELTRDFAGALDLCRSLERDAKGATRARVLYLEGLAWEKMARREAGRTSNTDRGNGAEKLTKKARGAWDRLEKEFPDAAEVPDAAFRSLMLTSIAGGRISASDAEKLLARFPSNPSGTRVLVALATRLTAGGGKQALAAAAGYLKRAALLAPDDGTIRLQYARVLARQKHYDEAAREFEKIARGDGRLALRAAFEAGRAKRALGSYREAVQYFDRVAKADAWGVWGTNASVQAADCMYMRKSYDEALARYKAAAHRATGERTRWDIASRRAFCLMQLRRDSEALKIMKTCLGSSIGGDQRARVYKNAADVAARMGRMNDQVAILRAWIEEAGMQGEAVNGARRLVRALLDAGDGAGAAIVARKLVDAVGPDDVDAQGLYAMTLYRTGREKDADVIGKRVRSSAGNNAKVVQEIGVEAARALYDRKKYAKAADAIRPYAESCRGEGPCERARYLYAMSLLGAHDVERGAAAARSFFRDYPVSPSGASLHLRMGNALVSANRTSEALIHYDEAAGSTADSVSAFAGLKNLAVSYQKLKRWKDAEAAWARVIARFPASHFRGEAALNAARCRMEQGDYSGAVAAYTGAMPLLNDEARARAYYWIGQSYEQLKDYSNGVVAYLKVPYLAAGTGMWVVTARLKAAECYRKLGRNSAAREIYEKVLRTHGEKSNWGRVARKALDELDAAGGTAPNDSGGGQ